MARAGTRMTGNKFFYDGGARMILLQLRERAFAAFQHGRPAEAERLCVEILDLSSEDVAGHSLLGHLRFGQQRYREALASYDRALASEPDDPDLLYIRANALQAMGQAHEALAGYERALARQPTFPAAWNNRANILLEEGRLEEALAATIECWRRRLASPRSGSTVPICWCAPAAGPRH